MKRLIILSTCILLLPAAGCRTAAHNKNALEPIAESPGKFPEFLVGTWRAQYAEDSVEARTFEDPTHWAFTFDPNGAITTVKHFFVTLPINVAEGGVHTPLKAGSYAYYALGPCQVDYKSATRELSVKIVLDHFHIELPTGAMEGTMTDWLSGPVSPDGRTWNAAWHNDSRFVVADSAKSSEIPLTQLTFKKID